MWRHIKLKKQDYFKVISKVTYRMLTVVGIYIEDDEVIMYDIKDEGQWYVGRFYKVLETGVDYQSIYNEIDDLRKRVQWLEQQIQIKDGIVTVHLREVK